MMIKTYAISEFVDRCLNGRNYNRAAVMIANDLMNLDMFCRIKPLSDEIIAALMLIDISTNYIKDFADKTCCNHPSVKIICDLIDGQSSTAKTFVQLCNYLATRDYVIKEAKWQD